MGRLTILKLQQDPDGLHGHEERQLLSKQLSNFPEKKNFTGGRNKYSGWNEIQNKIDSEIKKQISNQEQLEKETRMKNSGKICFKKGCNENNCLKCCKNPNRKIKVLKNIFKRLD